MGWASHQFQHWVYWRAPSNISWLGEQWEVLATAGRGLLRPWCFGNSPSFALQTIQILVVLTVEPVHHHCAASFWQQVSIKYPTTLKKNTLKASFWLTSLSRIFFFFLRGDTPSPLKYYWELTFSLKLLPHRTPEENDILVSLSTVKCFRNQP